MNSELMIDRFLEEPDEILIVSKNFRILYNSRYSNTVEERRTVEGASFFDLYPYLKRNNSSSIYRTISTGKATFREKQLFQDKFNNRFMTKNVTLPIYRNGIIVAAIEISRDLANLNEDRAQDIVQEEYIEGTEDKDALFDFDDIKTRDTEMKKMIELSRIYALNDAPTLIYGETGTGKEMFAQAMIKYGGFDPKKTVIQNCAAIPENLYESTFFGTVKGAYTGAETRKGLFNMADGGVFFLDEINSIPYAVQGKLLRVIQEGSFRPIGANTEHKVKTKVIAAMNVEPHRAMREKMLREDLFYRLANNMIFLPPLRERPDDIDYLTGYYIAIYNRSYGKNIQGITYACDIFFHRYPWNGNVRELAHVIESMIISAEKDVLDVTDLPKYIDCNKGAAKPTLPLISDDFTDSETDSGVDIGKGRSLKERISSFERALVKDALARSRGNVTKAAKFLDVPRQTLTYKIEKYKL